MDYDFNSTLWQTRECARCGGCCYIAQIRDEALTKKDGTLCDFLTVDRSSNSTSCAKHGKNKPESCDGYSCIGMSKYERMHAANIVLDVFKITPVPNAEEIRAFLNLHLKEMKGK